MKNRTELAKYFAKKGYKKGAEVGVYLGYYSRILLDNIPDLELMCVDSWSRNRTRVRAYKVAKEMLSKYPGAKVVRGKSMDVAKTIPDESLDFVYIDADHSYEAVKEDINAWAKKVRSGGVVSGHDYFTGHRSVQVVEAVDEYIKEHNLELKLTDRDEENPHPDDRQESWYFIKP